MSRGRAPFRLLLDASLFTSPARGIAVGARDNRGGAPVFLAEAELLLLY
jgi:hypothetical protein